MPYYGVRAGRDVGIFTTWKECNASVKGYPNAKYKKFATRNEAEEFVTGKSQNEILISSKVTATTDHISTNNSSNNSTNNTNRGVNNSTNNSTKDNDFNYDYCVYTDGACSNNGKLYAKAGIGIFFGHNDKRNVSERVDGKQTNNTAELTAIIKTYPIIENDIIMNNKKIVIFTDSIYAIRCATTYGEKCKKQNWEVKIPNQELVKIIYELYNNKPNVELRYIKAHTNKDDIHSLGNDMADKLANVAIGHFTCPYRK